MAKASTKRAQELRIPAYSLGEGFVYMIILLLITDYS
jgi:hypothetical protein